MNGFRRHDMVTCGFPVSGIGATVGMCGLKDIGSSHVRVMYMRTLNGAKVLTAGYCNPADGVKTIGDTMSVVTTTIGMVTGVTIGTATGMTTGMVTGMTMEDTKIVES